MLYTISSHIKYYKDTYPVIIQSLIDAGINKNEILMVVGGWEDEELTNPLNITLTPVKYNSFDLTALIHVSDILDTINHSHIFLMHDTCLVGPDFKILSSNYNKDDVIKTLRPGISMNIGLYSKYIIKKNIPYLNQFKFYPKSEDEIQQSKEFFVVNEDLIFKSYPHECYKNYYVDGSSNFLTLDDLKVKFNREPYLTYFDKLQNSNIKRDIGWGKELDFYKFQANSSWGDKWKIGL